MSAVAGYSIGIVLVLFILLVIVSRPVLGL